MPFNLYSVRITDPFMFAAVFSNADLCKELLEFTLEVAIDHVEIIAGECAVSPEYNVRGVHMDVYLADEEGTVYNVELQCCNDRNVPQRARYHINANVFDCIQPGMGYGGIRDSYVIFFCMFDPVGRGLPVYTVTPRCQENGVEIPDGTTRMYLNAEAWADCTNETLRSFLRYIADGTIGDEDNDGGFTRKVDEAVRRTRQQPEWRHDRMRTELHMAAIRAEARAEGKAEGRAEGKAEGKAEGRAEVKEEQRSLNRQLAERLMADGRANDLYSAMLDPAEFDRLVEEYGIVPQTSAS